MREENRLRALQVRVAWHWRVQSVGRAVDQRRLDRREPCEDPGDGVLEVQPLVDRDLIVARPAGVELAADGADLLLEPPLDVHVEVLELRPEGERAVLDLPPHLGEPVEGLGELGWRQQAGALERAGPGFTGPEVVSPEPPVEGERCGEPFRRGVCGLAESPAPGLQDSSEAMSAMIRRVTSSRRTRSPRRRADENVRGAPMQTRRGWRRGTYNRRPTRAS